MKDIDTTAIDLTTSDLQIKLHHTVASFTTTLAKSTQRYHHFQYLDH